MKNILLLVHDDTGQEARFQAALDLARALEGHVTCLDVTYVPPIFGGGMYEDGYAIAELVKDERARETTNRTRLEARLATEDVSWDWIDVTGEIAGSLMRAADLADVIVLNGKLEGFTAPEMRATREVIVSSGRPVLAVPEDCKRLDVDAALVAWDGSEASIAAMRAAVPILKKARRVVLLEANDGSVATSATDAAQYLSRHGITCAIEQVSAPDGAGAAILHAVSDGGFDYVVMGGFGHQRFVEAIFGGVTRTLLAKCPVPVFLAR